MWFDQIKYTFKDYSKKIPFFNCPTGDTAVFWIVYLDKFWEFDQFFDDSDMLNSWFFDQKWHKINIKLACPQGDTGVATREGTFSQ